MDVMGSFIEAFRYTNIANDIFSYLCEMKGAPFSTKLGYSERKGLNYEKYEQSFIYGMKHHTYAKIALNNAIAEYLYYNEELLKYKSINAQISTAYANFTWFLSEHGFTNDKKIPECKLIGNFLHNSLMTACFKKWHLEDADLTNTDLAGANLIDAYLTDANLEHVHLIGTQLTLADLRGANLTDANLTGADLRDADLRGAKYCNAPRAKTIFPEGFDPKEYGMIEVDIDGDRVEDE